MLVKMAPFYALVFVDINDMVMNEYFIWIWFCLASFSNFPIASHAFAIKCGDLILLSYSSIDFVKLFNSICQSCVKRIDQETSGYKFLYIKSYEIEVGTWSLECEGMNKMFTLNSVKICSIVSSDFLWSLNRSKYLTKLHYILFYFVLNLKDSI